MLIVAHETCSSTPEPLQIGQDRLIPSPKSLAERGTSSSSSADTSNPFAAAMLKSVSASAQMQVAITYPGEVLETNGVVSGKTVTWSPKFGEVTQINAVVKAPQTNLVPLFIGGVSL